MSAFSVDFYREGGQICRPYGRISSSVLDVCALCVYDWREVVMDRKERIDKLALAIRDLTAPSAHYKAYTVTAERILGE